MNGKNSYPTFYDRYAGVASQNDLQAAPNLTPQAQPAEEKKQFNPWLEMGGGEAQNNSEQEQKSFNSPWEMP